LDEFFEEPIAPQIDDLWEQLRQHGEIEESVSLPDFINADQGVVTTGSRTLEEIAESCSSNAQQINEESDDEVVDVPQIEPISRQAAYKGFDQLRRYIEQNGIDPKLVQACHLFEDFLYQEQIKKSVQTSITQFLP